LLRDELGKLLALGLCQLAALFQTGRFLAVVFVQGRKNPAERLHRTGDCLIAAAAHRHTDIGLCEPGGSACERGEEGLVFQCQPGLCLGEILVEILQAIPERLCFGFALLECRFGVKLGVSSGSGFGITWFARQLGVRLRYYVVRTSGGEIGGGARRARRRDHRAGVPR